MRCKKHPADLSGGGVCAICLRQRLLAVVAAQAQKQQLPPLSLPRCVPTYTSRRKTDAAVRRDSCAAAAIPRAGEFHDLKEKSGRNGGKFSSLFLGLFRSKSSVTGSGLNSDQDSDPAVSVDFCSASPSWFSNSVAGRRNKHVRAFSLGEKQGRDRARGMSPATKRTDDDGGSSGYSSESSAWKQTPRRTPATTHRGGGMHCKNVSGLALCISPLIRASPNRNWNQKALPPDSAGETVRKSTSFCKNRSRKLADFGRYSHNH